MSKGWGYYRTARPAKIADDPPTTVVERKFIDLCGWDPVSRSVIDFKLDADTVSDATIIRSYSQDVREDFQCVEVFGFILAVLLPGV